MASLEKSMARSAEQLGRAEDALVALMRRAWPPGTRVGVRLQAGQMRPSWGTVIETFGAYSPDRNGGTLCVKMDSALGRYHRLSHRNIHVNNIMESRPPGS